MGIKVINTRQRPAAAVSAGHSIVTPPIPVRRGAAERSSLARGSASSISPSARSLDRNGHAGSMDRHAAAAPEVLRDVDEGHAVSGGAAHKPGLIARKLQSLRKSRRKGGSAEPNGDGMDSA